MWTNFELNEYEITGSFTEEREEAANACVYVICYIELMTRRSEYDALERVHGHRTTFGFVVRCRLSLLSSCPPFVFLFFASTQAPKKGLYSCRFNLPS